jgi:hypothetical protein
MSNELTISEVCKRYLVTRKTLYNWKNSGKLQIIKHGSRSMILRDEIESLAQPRNLEPELVDSVNTQSLHKEIALLSNKVERLENVITQLLHSNNPKMNQEKGNSSTQSKEYQSDRRQAAIDKARTVFHALPDDQKATITPTEVARLAGIDRRTAKKYWDNVTK